MWAMTRIRNTCWWVVEGAYNTMGCTCLENIEIMYSYAFYAVCDPLHMFVSTNHFKWWHKWGTAKTPCARRNWKIWSSNAWVPRCPQHWGWTSEPVNRWDWPAKHHNDGDIFVSKHWDHWGFCPLWNANFFPFLLLAATFLAFHQPKIGTWPMAPAKLGYWSNNEEWLKTSWWMAWMMAIMGSWISPFCGSVTVERTIEVVGCVNIV